MTRFINFGWESFKRMGRISYRCLPDEFTNQVKAIVDANNDLAITMPSLYQKVLKLMGNRFEISVVADDESWADE